MDTDNITIYEKDLLAAQRICAAISDTEKRNKAVASVIAAKIASGYFDSETYEVDTKTGLHNIAPISEKYEIADIYINGAYVDVRVYFSDDEMSVPKVHFDTGILPVAYMFIKLSADLKDAVVTGFIYPESINKNNHKDDVYTVSPDDLYTLYDVEMRLHKSNGTEIIEDTQIYELLEGSLSEEQIADLFKVLISSKYSREQLIKAVNAQSVFNFVSISGNDAAAAVDSSNAETETIIETVLPEPSDSVVQDDEVDLTDEDLDSLFEVEPGNESDSMYSTEVTPSGSEVIESLDNEAEAVAEDNPAEDNPAEEENSEQIEALFTGEQQGVPVTKKKSSFMPVLLIALLLCGGAYFWYSHLSSQQSNEDYVASQTDVADVSSENSDEEVVTEQPEKSSDAMPVETVEDTKTASNKEESASVGIPAIERSLDASILVSNLKIDWEVPEGYASNTSAKRYLVKLGKVIQLNLKTELLLLNKPPLSNKITVELKYNPGMSKFEVVGIQMSSGEKTVDDTILQTVKGALDYSIGANIDSFGKLQGNPILIIHL